MKRVILLCIGAIVLLTGCSKDEESASKYSKAEQEALQVLNGTFACEGTTIVFSPFAEPTSKKSTMNDVPMKFCGSMTYNSQYYDNEFYFYLKTDTGQIVANAKHSEKNDYFNAIVGKTWDYKIVNNNTIELFDTDLSNPIFHTKTFIRQ